MKKLKYCVVTGVRIGVNQHPDSRPQHPHCIVVVVVLVVVVVVVVAAAAAAVLVGG